MGKLTARQIKMICDSEPSERDPTDGCGAELWTGADYAVARSLEKRGLGEVHGPTEPCGLYFNNADGLAERRNLLGISDEDDDEDSIGDAA